MSTAPAPPPSAPAPPARPARRRENTRARLLEAASRVFAEQGVKRVTVDELVAAAGFTRGAFYSNFSSIEEVFFAVFADQADRMLGAVRAAIDSVPEGDFSLESIGLVLESLAPFGREWYLIQNEFVLLALRSEEARAVLLEHDEDFRAELVEVIGDVMARLDRTPKLPLEQVSDIAVALYMHSISQVYLGKDPGATDKLVRQVLPEMILSLSSPGAQAD